MSKRRRLIVALGAVALAAPLNSFAQTSTKVPRIGILFIGSRNQPHLESFKRGLAEHGYTEGKSVTIEYRYAEGKEDRLPALAAELVQLKVDVIVVTADMSAEAAQMATKTIPIVVTTGDPVAWGLADSLAKPKGNVTGLSVILAELSAKRVELLKDTYPKMTRLATLLDPKTRVQPSVLSQTRIAARALGLQLDAFEVETSEDIEKAFASISKVRSSALLVLLSPSITLHSKQIVESALKQRLPGIYPTRQFAEEGGLMAYGPLIGDLYYRAANYVDKILKGAKPADLPVEQPTKFELVLNMKTAKTLGIRIPQSILVRADRVIE
jgi:putative ABC transport system substrate-binding protein